ncbi:MAG: hypothetical protein FJ344_01730 [Sphingomonadales bacterium]|nr:hypothetical protein [Sphingomonadales bacterium]
MNKTTKDLIIGALMGLVGPALVFLLFFGLQSKSPSPEAYVSRLHRFNLLSPILSMCTLINLGSFFLLLRFEQLERARGVLLSTLLMAILVAYVKFSG